MNALGAYASGDAVERDVYGVKCIFRRCPRGAFWMGSPSHEAGRFHWEVRHKVTLTSDFWLLETPVTQELWQAVTRENPSRFRGDDLPMETVSWDDATGFVAKLNIAGLAPVGMRFDLPTEAEWEYACRAGTTTRYYWGDELTEKDANFDGVVGTTTPVKAYAPNAWGLYDMHGNVCEWTQDWFDKPSRRAAIDPVGPSCGASRVNRGGGWSCDAEDCRSASRLMLAPIDSTSSVGFRLALKPTR